MRKTNVQSTAYTPEALFTGQDESGPTATGFRGLYGAIIQTEPASRNSGITFPGYSMPALRLFSGRVRYSFLSRRYHMYLIKEPAMSP